MAYSSLPPDVQGLIMLETSYFDLLKLCQTSKSAHNICKSERFWFLKTLHDINTDEEDKEVKRLFYKSSVFYFKLNWQDRYVRTMLYYNTPLPGAQIFVNPIFAMKRCALNANIGGFAYFAKLLLSTITNEKKQQVAMDEIFEVSRNFESLNDLFTANQKVNITPNIHSIETYFTEVIAYYILGGQVNITKPQVEKRVNAIRDYIESKMSFVACSKALGSKLDEGLDIITVIAVRLNRTYKFSELNTMPLFSGALLEQAMRDGNVVAIEECLKSYPAILNAPSLIQNLEYKIKRKDYLKILDELVPIFGVTNFIAQCDYGTECYKRALELYDPKGTWWEVEYFRDLRVYEASIENKNTGELESGLDALISVRMRTGFIVSPEELDIQLLLLQERGKDIREVLEKLTTKLKKRNKVLLKY